ncbi:tetratricopeptide repeat protein [Phenylobacterium sp. LjRoot219]|uniref:glycosyltransferase family 9 protein n=1 Tax=Phenylobacterium sp. LjRoot219 TaxID=3342283 RepID=UPI003ECD9E9E
MSALPAPAAPPPWVEILLRDADDAYAAGRHALALAIHRRVAAAAPDHAAAAQRLGAMLNAQGLYAEAETALRRAVTLAPQDPGARYALAVALLGQGRFAAAADFYRARFELPQLRRQKPVGLRYPEWAGGDLSGKRLVVFPEAGLGDQIQFARFAAQLRDQGAEVWLLCAPPLARLFATSLPGVQVRAAQGDLQLPDPDYWTTSGALMFGAGTELATLPAAPYLRPPAVTLPVPPGLKIGLMTASDPGAGDGGSLPPAEAERLRAGLPGEVYDLSPTATGARDFADTAALIAALDLVVTVDGAVAQLAGALGKRAFVLLPRADVDWCWAPGHEDSPWHPSLRLYRADPQDGWGPTLDRLLRDAQTAAN